MNVSTDEVDALRELINIGVGQAAGALHDMIGRTVQLNVPSVRLVAPEDIRSLLGSDRDCRCACVRLDFTGGLRGAADLIFSSDSGAKLVTLLTGEDPQTPDLDGTRASTLTEVGNILLNSLMGSITNILRERLDYGLPVYLEETAENVEKSLRETPDVAVLLAQAQFFVAQSSNEYGGERIDGEITLLLGVDSLEHLIARVEMLGEEALI